MCVCVCVCVFVCMCVYAMCVSERQNWVSVKTVCVCACLHARVCIDRARDLQWSTFRHNIVDTRER